MPVEANGAPLSLRMASGRPQVRNRWRRWGLTPAPPTSGEALAAEEIATEVVDDGERVAVGPIAHPELALEVDGPDLVRGRGLEGRRSGMLPPPTPTPLVHLSVARQDIEDRAAGGPVALGIPCAEALEDLSGPPAESSVFLEDQRDDVGGGLMRARARGTTPIGESPQTFLLVPVEPFVAGVAADAVTEAEFRHGPRATREVLGEMMTFEHGVGLLPGHRSSSHRGSEKCHPCARTSVTYVPRLYRRHPNNALQSTPQSGAAELGR